MRVLADGKTKLTVLATKPVNPAKPTVTELNAGLDFSCKVLASDFKFGPTASEKLSEQALCDDTKANALGASNWEASITIWREYLSAGGVDPSADAGFAAVKTKGTTLYIYTRQSDKAATAVWASTDEIEYGAEVATDNPQSVRTGWTKYTVPMEVQKGLCSFTTPGP